MAMLHDAQANVVLTTTAEQAIVQPLVDSVPDAPPLSWVATDALDPALAADWQMPEISPESPFVIMYTSGSTGAPRGVFSLHETLSAVVTLSMSMELDLGSLLVWAPLYHGSGLMSAGLVPLMYRAPLFLIPPIAVMERPLRLLKAISRYQITSCGGPNFIYQYCVDRVTPEEHVGLDLSSWTRGLLRW